ncbi:helix-turn-helix transcriptional regulator [Rhodoblastus sp.]|jgi:putative molybdopterin biosynthesis protein|uniref:helix-turn-helix transcriptional regulator n=1 Tax=Rhodoblastus sp. TaxID=1962975 RepID=UPI0025FA84CA|nr:helix-turn-helix transcriptional regulator [Rhodoblastus sp.]
MNERSSLTAADVAAMLHVSKSGIYGLIKNGEIDFYKVGRKIRFTETNVRDYIEKSKNSARAAIRAGSAALDEDRYFDLSMERRKEAGFIICGQDLILDVLSNFMRMHGVMALRAYIGSYDSLVSLYHDRISVASAHLWDSLSDDYNVPYVRSILPGIRCVVVNVTYRTQGLYVAKGNPKNIRTWRDFARDDITMINREKGAGARVLLDENLKLLGLYGSQVRGYGNENQSHLTVASAVGRGDADVAVGNEKIARQVENVDFIPLKRERYDLVVKREHFETPEVVTMLKILRSERFQNEFKQIGGYDISDIGKIVAET